MRETALEKFNIWASNFKIEKVCENIVHTHSKLKEKGVFDFIKEADRKNMDMVCTWHLKKNNLVLVPDKVVQRRNVSKVKIFIHLIFFARDPSSVIKNYCSGGCPTSFLTQPTELVLDWTVEWFSSSRRIKDPPVWSLSRPNRWVLDPLSIFLWL